MNIILGIIIFAIGILLVLKTEWFQNNFGRIVWFEKQFGTSGGSRLGYKMIGIIILFIGIIFLTGGGEGFMGWILSPLLRYN